MKRLNRAALYAVGAGTIAVATACTSTITPVYGAPAADSGEEDASALDDSSTVALYGAPADASFLLDASADDAGDDGSNVVALYGAPAPVDAGQDGETVAPLYGAAPADSGKT